jgi:hypothetical protein
MEHEMRRVIASSFATLDGRVDDLPTGYVATTTARNLEWENSHVIAGDASAGVAELKQRDGQDLVIIARVPITMTSSIRGADAPFGLDETPNGG